VLLLRQRGSFCKTANWKYRQQALILQFGTRDEPCVAHYTMPVKPCCALLWSSRPSPGDTFRSYDLVVMSHAR